jgi:hypothetical protein
MGGLPGVDDAGTGRDLNLMAPRVIPGEAGDAVREVAA